MTPAKGYFRGEWTTAVQRLPKVQGRKLLFPVIVDEEPKANASYELVPDAFRQFQFSHAPGGRMSPQLRAELKRA